MEKKTDLFDHKKVRLFAAYHLLTSPAGNVTTEQTTCLGMYDFCTSNGLGTVMLQNDVLQVQR